MDKKLTLKTGILHQLYIAIFMSIGVIFAIGIFIVLAIISGDTVLPGFIAIAYALSAIWLIFLLVRIIFRTKLTVTEKGFTMKMWRKVLWEIDWSEIESIEYFTMP